MTQMLLVKADFLENSYSIGMKSKGILIAYLSLQCARDFIKRDILD